MKPYKLTDVVYSEGEYWVLQVKNGFEVYRTRITSSTRVAQIGYKGEIGLQKAISECKRRNSQLSIK